MDQKKVPFAIRRQEPNLGNREYSQFQLFQAHRLSESQKDVKRY